MKDDEPKIIKDNMKCCPFDNTSKIIGKKFTVHIIRNMSLLRQSHFSEFMDSIEGINPKTLSTRLREMEKNGLIQRSVYPGAPVKIQYFLTKKGRAFIPILDQIAEFSMQFYSKDVFKDGKPRTFNEVYSKLPEISR